MGEGKNLNEYGQSTYVTSRSRSGVAIQRQVQGGSSCPDKTQGCSEERNKGAPGGAVIGHGLKQLVRTSAVVPSTRRAEAETPSNRNARTCNLPTAIEEIAGLSDPFGTYGGDVFFGSRQARFRAPTEPGTPRPQHRTGLARRASAGRASGGLLAGEGSCAHLSSHFSAIMAEREQLQMYRQQLAAVEKMPAHTPGSAADASGAVAVAVACAEF